jgi:hypothetical protein
VRREQLVKIDHLPLDAARPFAARLISAPGQRVSCPLKVSMNSLQPEADLPLHQHWRGCAGGARRLRTALLKRAMPRRGKWSSEISGSILLAMGVALGIVPSRTPGTGHRYFADSSCAAPPLHFQFPDAANAMREKALDIILVNSKSAKKPRDAQALAQANLDGGGNTDENRRAKTPLPSTHVPNQVVGADIQQMQRRVQ